MQTATLVIIIFQSSGMFVLFIISRDVRGGETRVRIDVWTENCPTTTRTVGLGNIRRYAPPFIILKLYSLTVAYLYPFN